MNRADQINEIARVLPRNNAQLARLLYRRSGNPLPRGMTSILDAIGEGPKHVTQLAEKEGVSQPSATRMVERLVVLGHATRERDPADGRVVVVKITPQGRAELRRIRTRHRKVFRRWLAAMTDEELRALLRAAQAIQVLIDLLQSTEESAVRNGSRSTRKQSP